MRLPSQGVSTVIFISRASRRNHLTLHSDNAELELGGPRVGGPRAFPVIICVAWTAELEPGGSRDFIYGDGFRSYFQGVTPISSGRIVTISIDYSPEVGAQDEKRLTFYQNQPLCGPDFAPLLMRHWAPGS